MNLKHLLLSIVPFLMAPLAIAQDNAASVKVLAGSNEGYIRKISDNGKWGVIEGAGTVEGSITPGGGIIINLETLDKKDISHTSGLSGVADISDDGTIVVGEAQGQPAYYSTAKGAWTILAMPTGGMAGRLEAVTPDGKYAAGYYVSAATSASQDFDDYLPIMYDLTTGKVIDLPGMPTEDMQHENKHMTMVSDMSADGRYLIGRVSQSYIQPPGIFSYVYDRTTSTYTPIGFTENKTGKWTPTVAGTHFCDFPFMSPNGEYVVGTAYMVEEIAGSEWPNEYKAVYRYHIPTGEYICYKNNTSEINIDGVSVLNDGTVTASTPTDNPYADAIVRSGDYFVTLDQILQQNYGVKLNEKTGWDNTGKLICASADGKTFVTLTSPTSCFIIHLPESITTLAAKVDLLAGYSATPAENSVMSKLKTFKVKFDRNITVKKAANKITFKSADGTESYTALAASVPEDATTTLSITFRTRDLTNGTAYTLSIPEGMVSISGDASVLNKAITLNYKGHDDTPMKVTSAYPADGASVAFIDLNNNPISMTFDMDLAFGENPTAALYRKGETTAYAIINLAIGENRLIAYPTSRVNLYQGTDYEMVIAAGTFTDLTGGCANEEIRLNWTGSYVREVSSDDIYLFSDNCDNYDNFMFYDGDRLTPASTPADWGFTKDVPWYIVRSAAEVSDMAFAAHSMYYPAGKADDWCMTPQIFIPDENCYLKFDAQSYLKAKTDYLKVYIYENENVYNTLTADIVADIRAKGELAFNEKLSPGKNEEGLETDWKHYTIKLDKYAGKDIYVAFVNDNEDQSAVFIDNIQIIHDMHFLVTVENPTRVINQDDITIKGNITIASEIDQYSSIELTLSDADGYTVSTIKESGLDLKKGSVYNFAFDTPLPLTKGSVNKYSMTVKLDDVSTTVYSDIKNLMFEPYKRIVVEEYSGRTCKNCPLGFIAMDNLKNLYSNRVLPVILRTYQSDPLGTSVMAYSNYLGLESYGAPSGRINRLPATYPMATTTDGYTFSGAANGDKLWLDQFMDEVAEPAEASISFTSTYNETTKKATVLTTVKNALNVTGANINIFAVVVENNVDAGYQENGYANLSLDILGQWGKGGKYGSAYVMPFTINEVARTTWGQTYQGTGGLIPSNIEAGKEYVNALEISIPSAVENPANCEVIVMLIDAITSKVLNANIANLVNGETNNSGVDNIIADSADIQIGVVADAVVAPAAETLTVATIDGRILGTGINTVALNGYKGIAIALARDANGATATAKLIIR